MAPQTGVHRVGRLAVEENIDLEVLSTVPSAALILARGLGNEAALGVFKVLRIVEFEFLRKLGVGLERFRAGVTGGATNSRRLAAADHQCQQGGQQAMRGAKCGVFMGVSSLLA